MHDFSCGLVVNNLKDRKRLPNQINRNRLNPILIRHEWSYSTMQNLRCPNSAVNELI